jgi:Spy/CpxP family protein refolding chaperone
MRRRLARLALVLTGAAALPTAATGQPPGLGAPDAPGPRVRLEALMRTRLGLDDAQVAQLRAVTGRFARERQPLVAEERRTRMLLREELNRGDRADQTTVAAALDRLLELQQRRLSLVQQEQRELARFLSPTQRAQFLGMQERAMRAAQQLRQDREMRRGPRGRGMGPPPGAPPG